MFNHCNKFSGLVLGFPKLGIFYEYLKIFPLASIELTSWRLKTSFELFGFYTQEIRWELIGALLILKFTIIQFIWALVGFGLCLLAYVFTPGIKSVSMLSMKLIVIYLWTPQVPSRWISVGEYNSKAIAVLSFIYCVQISEHFLKLSKVNRTSWSRSPMFYLCLCLF